MSLRTPTIDSARVFAPTEVYGPQRYYCAEEGGQHGVIFYFPEHYIPQGPAGVDFSPPYSQGMPRADGQAPDFGWEKTNSWYGANVLAHGSSPWGYAVDFKNTETNHTAGAACLEFGPTVTPFFNSFTVPTEHWCVFIIARTNQPASGLTRRLFSINTGDGHTVQLGYTGSTESIFYESGFGILVLDYAWPVGEYLRDDGWMLIALNQRWTGSGSFGLGGEMDFWINGVMHRYARPVYSNLLEVVFGCIVGADYERKDGVSWDGTIAHLSCVVGGKTPIGNDQIREWFDDPWWFLRAENAWWANPGCPAGNFSLRRAADGELGIARSSDGHLSVARSSAGSLSVEPAASGELSVARAADGNLSICEKRVG